MDFWRKILDFFTELFSSDTEDDQVDEWKENEISDEVKKKEMETQVPVVQAPVRCTSCIEETNEILVYSKENKNVSFTENKDQLNHKDTVFKDNFIGCRNTKDGKCKIDILENMWLDYDESTQVGDGYALNMDTSYMICKTGIGIIYLSDSGQIESNKMEDKWLDFFLCEESFIKMGWATDGEKLIIYNEYDDNVFDELKKYLKKYDVKDPISILMFLATIKHESGSGEKKLETGGIHYFKNKVDYSANVRGAGLMQITHILQKYFLEDIYKSLPENDPERNIIEEYINHFSPDGKENLYKGLDGKTTVAEYIATNYPIESAAWYWGSLKRLNYKEGKMVGNHETLNEFVVRHTNDNLYNTFAATQMAENGCQYGAHALDRFAECQNNCQIIKTPTGGCGGNHAIKEYCFYLIEDVGDENGDVNRHDYGPNNWADREKAYMSAYKLFEEEEK